MVTTCTIEVVSPLCAIPAHNAGWYTIFVSVFVLERGICLVWVFTRLILDEMEVFASAEQH